MAVPPSEPGDVGRGHGPRGPVGGPGSPPASRARPAAGGETGPARHPGPPPPGTGSGRAAFFERQPAPRQEEVQERAQGHVAGQALPHAAFTAARAQ